MIFQKINKNFPFSRLLKLLIIISVILQLFVISMLYFFRRHYFDEPYFFLFRFLQGTTLTLLTGFILAYPDLLFIRFLNKTLPWKKHVSKRFLIQFLFTVITGVLITPLILMIANLISSFKEEIRIVFLNNAYYFAALNLFLMVLLEAFIYLEESYTAKIEAEKLEKKLIAEASKKEIFEIKAQNEEDKNRVALQLIEKEKLLNQTLEHEIRKREILVKELNESRKQIDSIMSNLLVAAFRCQFDENYTVNYISEKIFDISGFPPSDFKDNSVRSFASIIHPDDVDVFKTNISEAFQKKASYEFEFRIIHRTGGIIWVKENGKYIYDCEDNLAFLDGIIIDITRSKEAELAGKESEINYKELMDLLPQTVFELDLEGKILLLNKAGDELFGPLPEDPNEKVSALDLFVKEDKPRIIDVWKKSGQGIKTEPAEYTAIKKDGTHFPVMIHGTPIKRNDKIVGRRGIIIDISKRKEYEKGLINAKDELERINNNLEQIVSERTKDLIKANTELLKVQKENLQSQFEVLKSQINPHFMFNSLNVLSGLINVDVAKAQLFIDEFSQIYRYVLETIEQQVVTLNKELEFMRSYLFLQQIRYGEALTYSVNIPAEQLPMVLPPLSLQVLLENAIKHNIINESKPLKIEIYSKGMYLFVKNPIQSKISSASTGLGLKNLVKRYALICKLKPAFRVLNNYYVAKIPLIQIEQDEHTNN